MRIETRLRDNEPAAIALRALPPGERANAIRLLLRKHFGELRGLIAFHDEPVTTPATPQKGLSEPGPTPAAPPKGCPEPATPPANRGFERLKGLLKQVEGIGKGVQHEAP